MNSMTRSLIFAAFLSCLMLSPGYTIPREFASRILPEPQTEDSLGVRRVGRALFEPFEAVAYSEGVCYMNSGRDVVMVDVTDPDEPYVKSYSSLPVPSSSEALDISADGDRVYVAHGFQGLWILERVGEDELEVAGSFETGSMVKNICVMGEVTYLASGSEVVILDVSDPGEPVLIGSYDWNIPENVPNDISVVDTLLYAACSVAGLRVLDVSEPTEPVEVGWYDTGLRNSGVFVRNVRAFTTVDTNELWVLNVEDPTHIKFVGSIGLGVVEGRDVEVDCHYAVVSAAELLMIDVSDARHMSIVSSLDAVNDFGGERPILDAVDVNGLRIVDLIDPEVPVERGFLDGNHSLQNIDVSGDYAYVCDDEGEGFLHILDVSRKHFPKLLGSFSAEDAYDVQVDFPLAYLASVSSGFYVLDVSDPDSVINLGHADVDAWGVFVRYPYAYLATESLDGEGLKILDVSRPDSLRELGSFSIDETRDVCVQDDIAYVASSTNGVYVLDVGDPENIVPLSVIPAYNSALDVQVSGHLLYIAAGNAGVRVIDVSDPEHPVEVGRSLVAYCDRLHVVEPYLFLSGGERGLRILDVSVPDSIHEVGYYDGITAKGVYSDGDDIYVGTTEDGFFIFEFSPMGIAEGDDATGEVPREVALSQNYPNPFNPLTSIRFDVPAASGERPRVTVSVYDLRGRLVRTLVDGPIDPGKHRVTWDGKDEKGSSVPSGVYFSRLRMGGKTWTRKMTLVR